MPEGDTIFRAAATLNRALGGQVVTRFVSVYPALTRVDQDTPIAGRTVERVESLGKHLLMWFSGDLILRTHMRMNGSWHVYPHGARWRRPARDARILVATERAVAVGFNVPVAELIRARDLARHEDLRSLGPDLLGEQFDSADAVRRVRGRDGDLMADLLLDQRVAAGIGNVFKCEILFLARINPFTRASDVTDAQLAEVFAIGRRVMTVSVKLGRRTTRSSLDPAGRLWVYGRAGQPCFRCRTMILAKKTGPDARITYWCPSCQPAR